MASFKQYSQTSGDASEAFSIKSFTSDEIKVRVDGTLKTAGTGTGSGSSHDYELQSYTVNGGTIAWVSGKIPATDAVIRIYRVASIAAPKATYSAGSSVKAGNLNDNQTQLLRGVEETQDQLIQSYDIEPNAILTAGIKDLNITTAKIAADAITGAKIADDVINSEHYIDASIDHVHLANDIIDGDNIQDDVINSEHYAAGSIDTEHIADNQITTAKIAADSITGAKIADDQINSEHYVDGSIDTAHIADSQVTTAKIAADAVNGTKIADNSIDSEHYVDGSIDTAHLADNSVTGAKLAAGTIVTSDLADSAVTTAKIAADAITGAKIADDQINSEHYIDGSIDTAHLANSAVGTAALSDDSVTGAKIVNNAVGSSKIAGDAVGSAQIANNAVGSSEIAADAVGTAQIADDAVTAAQIAANAVGTTQIADAELTTLAGMQTGTASILAAGTTLTATLAEINTVVDGKSVETTISDTDAAYPTSGAVVDYVAAQIAPVGGLEVIATDAAFPNTQPGAGVVISIADAGGLVVNGSGVSTTGRTVGGSTVTINNINSQFNSTTIDAGVAMMVSSTGSSQTYNYHKATLKEADLLSLSGDINDFAERYKVAGSAPSSSLDEGDLWWDTATDKLKVYSGASSSWEEVASAGDFYINTISSYSGTGGNSATFNGSAYRFVLSNPGTTAQQLIVSINGVIQKPNAGTSQPSEGFAINGSSILFSAAPASGADYFIITVGTTVSIGTPSDNTVSTAKIQNLAVTTAKIAADAVDGTKIADDAVGAEHIEVLDANLQLADAAKIQIGTGNDLEIYHASGNSYIANKTGELILGSGGTNTNINITPVNTEKGVYITTNGATELYYDNSKKLETHASGLSVFGQISNSTSGIGSAFADNTKAAYGTGDDLQIYHDGSHSYIKDAGTGQLRLQTSLFSVENAGGTENILSGTADGAVNLYYDAVKKFETTADGAKVYGDLFFAGTNTNVIWDKSGDNFIFYDNAKASFGSGEDLQIYHDGSHSKIKHGGTGNLNIYADTFKIVDNSNGDNMINANSNGAVELYYNNAKEFRTVANGVELTSDTHASGTTQTIYLSPTNQTDQSRSCSIAATNTDGNNNNDLLFKTCAAATPAERLRIKSDGNIIPGTNNATNIGDGTTNFNSIWASTRFRGNDNVKLILGDAQDLLIYHDGSDSFIDDAGTGKLFIRSNEVQINKYTGENLIKAVADGGVELYYDNVKTFQTHSTGITVVGPEGGDARLNLYADEADDNADLWRLLASSAGNFHIQNASSGSWENSIYSEGGGDVSLYYAGNRKFATHSNGTFAYTMLPFVDNADDLGASSYRWDDVYATNGTIQTSDRNEKNTIVDSDLGLSFVNKLKPVSYKFNGKTRTHYGLISQDVETTLSDISKTTTEFAGFIKEDDKYGLRYTEFIGPLVKAVQELSAEVETLKTKVAALEAG